MRTPDASAANTRRRAPTSSMPRRELMLDLRRYSEAQPFIEAALQISVRIGETWNPTELTADPPLAPAGQGDLAGATPRPRRGAGGAGGRASGGAAGDGRG